LAGAALQRRGRDIICARLYRQLKNFRIENDREGHEFHSCRKLPKINAALAAEGYSARRIYEFTHQEQEIVRADIAPAACIPDFTRRCTDAF
jgi:hypothetical protein